VKIASLNGGQNKSGRALRRSASEPDAWSPDNLKENGQMPKMKTKKAASKRFKVRSGGSIKRAHATKRHILTHRTTKNKRHLRGMVTIHESDSKSIHRMLPYA
jgi:large subunit ribosomal protein L35